MAVYPTVGVGFSPCSIFFDSAKTFGNNALVFLIFVPYWTSGLVHHLISADHPVFAPAQETSEK
jgi:ABC-type spermidine/putrescine transport system permease subunit I